MPEGPEVRPEDALQVAQRALAKVNDLEDEIEQLREDVTKLELRYGELDEERSYEGYTLDEKVGIVREHAFQRALDAGGRTSLTYDDVMWGAFDGEPGAKHSYKLLRLAAGYDQDGNHVQDIPGFDFDGSTQPMRLTVNAERAKTGAAFFPENKTESAGGDL